MNEPHDDEESPLTVIDELASLDKSRPFAGSRILNKEPDLEACLRRVLRSHEEAGFEPPADDWIIYLRARLDVALTELTVREIRDQLGLPNEPLSATTCKNLGILFGSEAFLRFVNAYLYFGVRLLASRMEVPSTEKAKPKSRDANVRPFRLCHPPSLAGFAGAAEKFAAFINLPQREPIATALLFLDHFHPPRNRAVQYELQEPSEYELWLRGLRPEIKDEQHERFEKISEGLEEWIFSRSEFYLSLQPPPTVEIAPGMGTGASAFAPRGLEARPLQGWLVTHPSAARLALADIYWIARLLRADVSESASVTYQPFSWVHLLRFRALLGGYAERAAALRKAEEAIRSVFGYVCDLVQNSIEVSGELDRQMAQGCETSELPDQAWKWRAVFDEELDEIEKQRKVRRFRDPSIPPAAVDGAADGRAGATPDNRPDSPDHPDVPNDKGWSKRIKTGSRPHALIGLAFSGGGIRSATFNLGVLQGLQELDLLRDLDYLSTVSGGGFIGSWLVANVRRSAHWLKRLTDWSASIAHLRAYSNYLAPRTGILSADTWNLANSWFRNAFLIQLTGLGWLFVVLLTTLFSRRVFCLLGTHPFADLSWAGLMAFSAGVLVTVTVLFNLHGTDLNTASKRRRSSWVKGLAVTPAWLGAFALASQFWANATLQSQEWSSLAGLAGYADLLHAAWRPWCFMLACSLAAFCTIAAFTLQRRKGHAIWIGPFCTGVLYLELVAVFCLLRVWCGQNDTTELAFVFGPSLVLLSFSVCILLLIGFSGRNTDEGYREWWTRFGTWLTIFAGGGLFIAAVAVFGPSLILWFFRPSSTPYKATLKSIKWTSALAWLGTVIGGLLAGKSSKTSGEGGSTNAQGLELLARVGGLLFIVGSFLLGSTLLYLLLFDVFAQEKSLIETSCFRVLGELSGWQIPISLCLALGASSLFSWFFEINIFGLNQFYGNRLVRCYLGASRWSLGLRVPNPFTMFDFHDDLKLSRFRTDSVGDDQCAEEYEPYRGPLPLINCTLNLGGSSDLSLNSRHSSSFTLTPLRCGCDRPAVGYAPTESAEGCFANGVRLGQAVAISGAAVSSNMGYNTSPLVAFLLTMFNVRLGWWFPNPGQASWKRGGLNFSLYYLVMELLGIAGEKRYYLNASDGGHFENLGVYELIRRRCRLIIASDAECDEQLQFGGLGNLIRICQTDFGAVIDMDVKSIRPRVDGLSFAHCAVGQIRYSSGDIGMLIYLKASVTGDEDVSIAQYRDSHPSFPHETTVNQFFSEDQFESYRALGLHVVRTSFRGNLPDDDPLLIAEKMADVLTPSGPPSEAFLKHSESLREIWEIFRGSPDLLPFMRELITLPGGGPISSEDEVSQLEVITDEELGVGLQLIQFMEGVFLDLRLDDFWEHPDNRGWAILFMRWSRSPRFRIVWKKTRRTFGIRFEYFCAARLGLERDYPMVRIY